MISFFDEKVVSKQYSPRWDAASDRGLFCLPMSHKMDTWLIWVDNQARNSFFEKVFLNDCVHVLIIYY